MKRKMKWMRMLAAAAFAVILALPFSAMADGVHKPLELEKKCSLTVNVTAGGTEYAWDEQLMGIDWQGVSVELYKVADVRKAAGVDDYVYSAGDANPFEAVVNGANDLLRAPAGADAWDALARQAAETVRASKEGNPIAFAYKGNVYAGVAGIDAGLYLMLIRDEGSDFKEIAMEDGTSNIATVVRSENYEYEFAPALVSLPMRREMLDDQNVYTGYEWVYDLALTPKNGISYRYGSLEIVKTLTGYRAGEPATFVFRVKTSYDDGRAGAKFEYDDIVTLHYDQNSPATQTVKLEGKFPMGARVTVTEVYSGNAYSLTTGEKEPIEIKPLDAREVEAGPEGLKTRITVDADTALAEFINEYDASANGGGAVVNNFRNNGTQWSWTRTTADSEGVVTGPAEMGPVVTPEPTTSPEPSASPEPVNQ